MKHPGGRPTDYKFSYNTQVKKLCLLGATDKQISDFFGINEITLNRWKKKYPKFCTSIKEGKEVADSNVAKSLYQRALGYSHKAIKILVVDKEIETKEYVERYPPDTTAAIFWLKNRNKENWRDKQDHEHSGKVTIVEEQPK